MCICYDLTQKRFYYSNCAATNDPHQAKVRFCSISSHLRGGRRWPPHLRQSPVCQSHWSRSCGDGSRTRVSRWQTPWTSLARNGLTSEDQTENEWNECTKGRDAIQRQAATHVEVLALPEGVEVVPPLLLAPAPSLLAVPHNNLLLHPGIEVEGDVVGAAPHKVELDSADTGIGQYEPDLCCTPVMSVGICGQFTYAYTCLRYRPPCPWWSQSSWGASLVGWRWSTEQAESMQRQQGEGRASDEWDQRSQDNTESSGRWRPDNFSLNPSSPACLFVLVLTPPSGHTGVGWCVFPSVTTREHCGASSARICTLHQITKGLSTLN